MSDEDWEQRRADLRDRYRFYILNPAHSPGVEYAFWVDEGEYEYPIMSSNTGGFVTLNTRDKSVGEGIQPTDEFLTLIGLGFHEAMCFMPDIYLREDHLLKRAQSLYDGKIREYELWGAAHLIGWMAHPEEQMVEELRPLVEWASDHTKFGVPVLGEEVTPDGE